MRSPAFDTHQAVKNITQAGADEQLAESIVNTMSEITSELVTKSDLKLGLFELETNIVAMEAGLKSDMVAMEGRLDLKIEKSQRQMTVFMGALIASAFSLFYLLIKLTTVL